MGIWRYLELAYTLHVPDVFFSSFSYTELLKFDCENLWAHL